MCLRQGLTKAVCRHFANGGRGGGGEGKLGVFKKKKGARSCKQRQGEHWKTMFKK